MGSKPSIITQIFGWLQPSVGNWEQFKQPSEGFIEFRNLSKGFTEGLTERQVLNNLSMAFEQGQFIVLLGQSGSGKSTLLNLISGIERPSSGTVLIDGVPITELNERDCTLFRRDQIGIIFQFFNLIPTLTVLENVTLPQELAGRSPADVESQALALLSKVGLGDRSEAFPDKLSGGQQQRVAIARALVHEPRLILADEPTGNLDEDTGKTVLELLLDLTRNANKTLIMATHNPEIATYADKVLRVHEGHLEDATAEFQRREVATL
ncbi:Sigma 54 interacting domain protein [[Leptolyngbya] sp. PCC 7376]|uniref:ABC transporter ATP-binding protein n=1 Tax=[Leptolyngbya] sp. PCC 7376 TaxID=111781 RepID=UPI00029F43EE|nr:ABC transporter ATP-binding protein [[Leptolyngbya] sp. PCC 7376]AFY40196.1 Sigma 54 interacting domain protein [[Leptolyngbya] sp. PCC 7376]